MIKVGFFAPGKSNELREMAGAPRVGDVVRLRDGAYDVKEVHWILDQDGDLETEADLFVVLEGLSGK
ncbi:hypothetical protein [Isoptericola sp. NPDC055881]